MKNKLYNKVAVITGASGGIGYAIAKALNQKACKVYNISRTECNLPEFTGSFSADVNDGDKIEEILKIIHEKEGKIDIFVNNAGFGIGGAVEFATKESIYKQIETNLSAVINLSRLAIKYLKETKGNLINICSVGGIIPLPYQASYSATKAGVDVFSRALANEVRGEGIKVTAVLPGDTKTGFTKARVIENNVADEKEQQKISKSIAKFEKDEERGKSPDTVAKVVVKVLNRKKPPLRVTVGFVYKAIVFLPRVVSVKLENAIVRKLYCKK